jgi:hypothetical protein
MPDAESRAQNNSIRDSELAGGTASSRFCSARGFPPDFVARFSRGAREVDARDILLPKNKTGFIGVDEPGLTCIHSHLSALVDQFIDSISSV